MKKNPAITDEQLQLRDKIKVVMEKKSLKASQIARITSRSEGTISDLLNSKKASSPKVLSLIKSALQNYMGETDMVMTKQAELIMNIAKSCKSQSDMRLVVGNTGIGKSFVFKKYAEETECCCYYKIYSRQLTWNQFLKEVCLGFGIELDKKRKRHFTSTLLEALKNYVESNADKNPILIVDESEVMRNAFFKEFKNLRTATEDLLGIVIVGITEVKDRVAKLSGLTPDEWRPAREDSNQYTTFARRIKHTKLSNITTADIENFCKERKLTDAKIIAEACKKWWNYDDAQRFFSKIEMMNVQPQAVTIDLFNKL